MIHGLSNGARLVLEGLRWALVDETPTLITQAEIAEVANVSESTVNRVMPELVAAGLLTLEHIARTDVRGTRWQVTTHTPAEVVEAGGWGGPRPPRSRPDDEGSSLHEPSAPRQRLATPQSAPAEGSPGDQHEDHDHDQGVEGDEAPTALLTPQQTLLYNALLAEGVRSHTLARSAAQALPDRTITEFREQVAYAAECGKVRPLPYVIALWSTGQMFCRPTRKEVPRGQRATRHHRRDGVRRGHGATHSGAAAAGPGTAERGPLAQHERPDGGDHAPAADSPELDLAAIYAEAAARLKRAQERRC